MKKLLSFFLITFFWSWLFWIPCIFSPTGINDLIFYIFFIIGAFGPFIGAHSIILINERKEGIIDLWKKFFNIRIEIKWLLIILFLFPAIMILAVLLSILFGEDFVPFSFSFSTIFLFFQIFFIGGPFNEEFGWRGYVLERLKEKYNALTSSIVLGIIWGIWHVPLFYILGSSQYGQPLILFIMMTTLLSILFTWIYNNTNNNVLAVMVFHCVFNFTNSLIPFSYSVLGILFFAILLSATVILVIIIFKPKTLTKEEKRKDAELNY